MLCMDLFYKTILLIVLWMYYFDILYKCISWIYSSSQGDSILIGSLSTLVIAHASEESLILKATEFRQVWIYCMNVVYGCIV